MVDASSTQEFNIMQSLKRIGNYNQCKISFKIGLIVLKIVLRTLLSLNCTNKFKIILVLLLAEIWCALAPAQRVLLATRLTRLHKVLRVGLR